MYMLVASEMGAVCSFCNVFMCNLTKDVSQCEVTHQSPFVCASSSVCQSPGHVEIISISTATSENITVVWKTTFAVPALITAALSTAQNKYHEHLEKNALVVRKTI